METLRKPNGFTIVELLIVIVVIGILVSVAIIAYSGVQKRALNSGRLAEFNAWQKQFEMYRAINNSYPSMPDGHYCLGMAFPNATCRNWNTTGSNSYPEINSSPLLTQLSSVGASPSSMRTPVNTHIGPYVTYTDTTITFTTFFNDQSGKCPNNTTQNWFGDGDTIMCSIIYTK